MPWECMETPFRRIRLMQISVDIPASLKSALEEKAGTSGGVSAVVTAALARYLEKPIHTIFQVATSGALVAGVYKSEVSVQTLKDVAGAPERIAACF
jgi:acetolactate decarboxylase